MKPVPGKKSCGVDWQDFPGDECIPPAPRKVRTPTTTSTPHDPDVDAPDPIKAAQIGWPDKYDDAGNDMHDLRFSGVDLCFHVGYTPPTLPPRHPDAKPPKGCQQEQCCYFDTGYVGHWYMFCVHQQKCIIRSAKHIKKSILADLSQREQSTTHREFVAWLFEHIAYGELTAKESELVESLELGEYGFQARGKLSVKQLKLLKDIFCQASSRI